MPDFQNFSVIRNGNVTISVPRFNITCNIINSTYGNLIRSFNITFPEILTNLSNQQLLELFQEFIINIIQRKLKDNTA